MHFESTLFLLSMPREFSVIEENPLTAIFQTIENNFDSEFHRGFLTAYELIRSVENTPL